jgi:hypothetical protein
MVQRGKVIKRYEYEAESPQLAGTLSVFLPAE